MKTNKFIIDQYRISVLLKKWTTGRTVPNFRYKTLRAENICHRVMLILVLILLSYSTAVPQSLDRIDFRYSPHWWQSVISLPDDPDKILVGKEGQLLFDYGKEGFRNFGLQVQIEVNGTGQWEKQETYSAKVPIVRTWEKVDGIEVLKESFVVPSKIDLKSNSSGNKLPPRRILSLVNVKNTANKPQNCKVELLIQSVDPVNYTESKLSAKLGNKTVLSVSEPFKSELKQQGKYFRTTLSNLNLKPLESRQVVVTIDRNVTTIKPAVKSNEIHKLRKKTCQWWENIDLPFNAIQVPDSTIQSMFESCVRNIWQARDIEKNKIAFKVGPTVYRNLFVVDGAFLLETAAILGRAMDAREGLEFMLSHQNADGSFNVIEKYYGVKGFSKENGIMLWAAFRHAQLSQDKEWLRGKWPALQRTVDAVRQLRNETMSSPGALEFGLIPGGYIDGGINNRPPNSKPEYSNVYWNLIGWKAAISAARWIGDNKNAEEWQSEYEDFYNTYRKAASRDLQKDSFGNLYVPMMMGNADSYPPAKGQWSFCHAVYPGEIFPSGDTLVEGQLAMLRATKVEGLVFDTGWMKDGLWTYFSSFYAHAMLWQGYGREAVNSLYDFGQHASPVRTWREEQKPYGKAKEEVGDMPHNWASAEFIRLAVHLLEIDRGNELHLFEGLPKEWVKAGMETALNQIATPFGELTFSLKIDERGKIATLDIDSLSDNSCEKVVVHLDSWATKEKGKTLELDPKSFHSVNINIE